MKKEKVKKIRKKKIDEGKKKKLKEKTLSHFLSPSQLFNSE